MPPAFTLLEIGEENWRQIAGEVYGELLAQRRTAARWKRCYRDLVKLAWGFLIAALVAWGWLLVKLAGKWG